MNNNQIAKSNMYKKMLVFFATPANSAVWAGFARLVTEVGNFTTLNATLSNYIQQHQQNVTGITQGKNNAFNAMVALVVNKSQKAFVWAMDTSNANLTELFDVQKTSFQGMAESTAFARIKNIRDALSANIASMASVQLVVADVTAVNAAVTAYQNTIGTPAAAKTHKTEGTQGIENLMHPIDHSLVIIDRLIITSYSAARPDMVNEYKLNRQIDDLPTHHNGVHAYITDAATGSDLKDAVLSIDGTGKIATSDINGIAEIIKVKSGTYNVTISLSGYQTQTSKIDIVRGKATELTVQMKQ